MTTKGGGTRWQRGGPALWLALVLAVALLHALAHARLRPLYQVSDEMAYLRAAQVLALDGASPEAARCIAPPDGQLFPLGEGGKAGFRAVTAWQLRVLCRDGGELPLFALRAVQALSLPAVALAAWLIAWQITRLFPAALAAALLVAVHPVAAKYAGGVTPDAWANAFAAGAFVSLTRIVLGRHRWWDLPLLAAWTIAGLLWKDTTNMLVPLTAAASVQVGVWWWRRRRDARDRTSPVATVVPAAGVAVAVVATMALAWGLSRGSWTALLATPYLADVAGAGSSALASPGTFVRAVLDDLLQQAPGFAASSLLSLYRPLLYVADDWWRQPMTPWGATAILVALIAGGLIGAARALVTPPGPSTRARLPGRAVAWWAVALVICAAQPSVRLVLLDVTGVHQGRWLLPVLAPASALLGIGLAAIVRHAAAVPLAVALGMASVWLVVLDLVRHYYVRLPDVLARGVLFTRPTGDQDVGDAAITALIVHVAAAQSAAVTWSILVLLAIATVGLVVAVTRDRPPATHHA